METTVEVPAVWNWPEIAEYVGCGRSKALNLLRACPLTKQIDYQQKRVLASDFIQWFQKVRDFREVC